MLTVEQKITVNGITRWGKYNRAYRTRNGAEKLRDRLIASGIDPTDLRITGEAAPTRRNRNEQAAGTLKVGDVLHSQWGYSMVINDFYEVTKVSPSGKTVTIRPLRNITVSGDPYSPYGAEVIPQTDGDDRFAGREIPNKRVQCFKDGTNPYVKLNSYSAAYLMTEADFHRTYTEDHWD